MTNEKEKDLESWDSFISGNFLKAMNVNSENDAFVIVHVDSIDNEDTRRIRLNLQRNEQEFDFDLNKTNAARLKELGIKSPKELVGKKIYFKKILVRNPITNKEVEGLRIYKIE